MVGGQEHGVGFFHVREGEESKFLLYMPLCLSLDAEKEEREEEEEDDEDEEEETLISGLLRQVSHPCPYFLPLNPFFCSSSLPPHPLTSQIFYFQSSLRINILNIHLIKPLIIQKNMYLFLIRSLLLTFDSSTLG